VSKQLGVSKVDEKNRLYLPVAVTKALRIEGGNHWLSWEQDDCGNVSVFKGSLRIARKNNARFNPGG